LDVDVRFLLANERTLLAWLRTALSLQAAGVALTQFAHTTSPRVIGLGLLTLGTLAALAGYARYRAVDRAIRAGWLPARGRGPALVTAGVVALAVALLVLYASSLL
jgi:putative membrane protein